MLLEFKFKNYKSFMDEAVFSMIPISKKCGLDYSVIKEKIGNKNQRALCSTVIYGPNASGKTNVFKAMETFKGIVLKGNVRNKEGMTSTNVDNHFFELISNLEGKADPTEFSITFVEQGLLIAYSVDIDFGPFLSKEYKCRILHESLTVNGKRIFVRGDNFDVTLPAIIGDFSNKSIKRVTPKVKEIAQASLLDSELFLTNGFKTIFAKELVLLVTKWFEEKLIIVCDIDDSKVMRKYANPKENSMYVESTITDAIKEFGINANELGYRLSAEDNNMILYSIFDGGRVVIPADLIESKGTIRSINAFPLVINVLMNGGTLVIDEFDSSIHPVILMNIISIFHNDEINKNHAQLIFNTHNPIYLDSSLFRKDEIKFVERNAETHCSKLYALSDFNTAKGEDYMKNYFINRYGAVSDVDFSPILKEIILSNGKLTS